MSEDQISGLSLRDRNYNSFFQDNIKMIDANGVGSPVLGQIVGGLVTSGTLLYTNYDGAPFSFGTDGRLRTDAAIVGSIIIGSISANVDSIYVQSGNAYQVSGNVNVVSGTITTVTSSFMNSGNSYQVSGNVFVGSIQGTDAVDSAITANPVFVGAKAESTVPTEVADGDAVNHWFDTFGRQVIKGTNLGQESLDVNEIAPWALQTINGTQLSAVGSSAGSHVGPWVNMADYKTKTVYYEYTSGTTAGMTTYLEASHNAGSTTYVVGSQVFGTTTANSYETNTEHHEYLRVLTKGNNSGGTLTVTLAGRGE